MKGQLHSAILGLILLVAHIGMAAAEDRWQTLPQPPPMPAAMKSGYAPVNGINMYYAVYGSGAPVLLIHGGLGHADIWANQVADLAKDHQVIVADSRGHGRSTRTAEPYGYDLMASDYLALLDYLQIDKTALVGWSDGGIIGLDIAMSHPERLTSLFAQAANVTVDGVKPDVMTIRLSRPISRVPARFIRNCPRRLISTMPLLRRSATCGKRNPTGRRSS